MLALKTALVGVFESLVGTAEQNFDERLRALRARRLCLVEVGIDADDVEALGEWYTDAIEARRTLRSAKVVRDLVYRLDAQAAGARMDELDELYQRAGGEASLARLVAVTS